jgi:signal transduction histidine kinase
MFDTTKDAIASMRADPARLAALIGTGLLDTGAEDVFDRLCLLASRLVGAQLSFISLVDENRDFFKSICGGANPLDEVREVTGPTFCHAALLGTSPLVIPDVGADPLYRDLPAHTVLGFSAYMGVPLHVNGQPIGAFCVIDTQPHAWTPDDVEGISVLAQAVQRELDLRQSLAAEQTGRVALETQNVELQARTLEAEGANKVKAEFLSAMSHELRTPLNAIGGYAELLLLGVRGDMNDAQRSDMERIQRAGRHLQTIVGDILNFARIESGGVVYQMRTMRVEDVVAGAVEMVAPQAEGRGVLLHRENCQLEADEGPLRITSDPERVRQILVNLISNAVKFTERSGTVQVCTSRNDTQVSVHVADTGRGIKEEDLERIFRPFVQVDRSGVGSPIQGVGLGLAISRDLARGMGGDLEARSTIGEGSTFTLHLPRSDA